MSDEALRELEHRWRASGSPGDEIAWLRARVRRGELSEGLLLLPAYLGYPAARDLCDPASLSGLGDAWDPPSRRLGKLSRFEREARVRIAIAAAHFSLQADPDPSPAARRALSAAESWVRCPCRPHALAAEGVLRTLGSRRSPSEAAARAAADAVANRPTNGAREAVASVDTPEQGSAARAAIAAEVAAWSLGYDDPLLLRVDARARVGLDGDCCSFKLAHSEHVELLGAVLRVQRGPTRLSRALGLSKNEIESVLSGQAWVVSEAGDSGLVVGQTLTEAEFKAARGRPGFRAESNAEALEARLAPGDREFFITRRLPDTRERPDRALAAATTALVERNERLGKLLSVDVPELILRRERGLLQEAALELEGLLSQEVD